MKKTLLSIFTVVALSSLSFGQIEIYVHGGTTDYSGGVYQISPLNTNEIANEIRIENHTGVSENWIVGRRRINEPASWTDYLCWGHEGDVTGGLCVDGASMDTPLFFLPGGNFVTVSDGEAGIISSHISPDLSASAVATYRYYVGTEANPYQDSVDIEISFTLGMEDITPSLSVSVAPNPASDYISINATGVEDATVRIVDVLGNVVLNETAVGTNKTVNVAKFRNGIYFVMVEASGVKPITRKVIVRH